MRILKIIISLFIGNVTAETLTTPDYQLDFDKSKWAKGETDNPPGYTLESKELSTKVTLSSLSYPEGKDLAELSKQWLILRLNSENDTLKESGRTAEIEESNKQIPIGYQVEYWGEDSNGRNFRFWSAITKNKIINIYIESNKQDSSRLEATFRSFLKTLRI